MKMNGVCLTLGVVFVLILVVSSGESSVVTQYPRASAVSDLIDSCPLLTDALDPNFFERINLDGDQAFLKAISDKLGRQAYRKFGPIPSVRVDIRPGHILEAPYIILEYQTRFNGIISIGGGEFGGNCVLVPGGRDAYAHRTFFGITEDEAARRQYLDMFKQRQAMRSNQRYTMTPEFDRLFNENAPKVPIETVKADIQAKIEKLVGAFKPYGAHMLEAPSMGQIGAKITDRLYLYIRDFSGGSQGSRTPVEDTYFWLIFSGGPRPMPQGYLPAFPGAEGMGATTTGGRGGKVIYVTNTNSEGPGSFVEAIRTKGPRIVLFKVSGQIVLANDTWIAEPDLTLIGYTAPGEGIEICGRVCLAAGNIIMRGMRWRLRPPLSADGMNTEGDLTNLIFDHCSFAYGSDEALRFIGQRHTFWNYTFQYCNIGPGMSGLGSHPYGPEIGGVGSIHHCILHDTLSRSPEVDCARIDWRNNIMFNLRSGHSKRLTNQFNFINNLIIDNPGQPYAYSFGATDNNYIAGNYREVDGEFVPFLAGENPDNSKRTEDRDGDQAPDPTKVTKQPWRVMPVTTDDAINLEKRLLPIVGAFLPKRDTTDTFWLNGIGKREAKPAFWAKSSSDWESYNPGSNERTSFIMWQSDNFPPPAAGAAAPADKDCDGMPDEYEKAHGFNPDDIADGSADSDGDGYTNVEECLYRTNPRQHVNYTDPANNLHTLH